MLRRSLNDIACGLAAHVRKNLTFVERGAVPVRLVDDSAGPLRVIEEGKAWEIPIKEGDIFLLPAGIPHSPQRPANTVGLVVEHRRPEHADDHMRWYCKQCGALVFDADFHLVDLGKQLKPIIEKFKNSPELRTCKSCGTVYPA